VLPSILEPTAGVAALPRSPEIVDGERPRVRAPRDLPHAATSRPQNGDLLALGKRQVPDGGQGGPTASRHPSGTTDANRGRHARLRRRVLLDSPRVIAAPAR